MFFDTDAAATLLSEHAIEATALEAAIPHAKETYEAYLDGGGSHDRGWFIWMGALIRKAGVPSSAVDGAVSRLRESHDTLNLWRKVRPGTREALERLRDAGMQLGVISNSEGAIASLLETVGLADLFETIVDSAVEGVQKPERRIFDIALERLGADAASSLYVGDVHQVDVVGARAAGLRAVLIDGFVHHPDYRDAPRIENITELAAAWT